MASRSRERVARAKAKLLSGWADGRSSVLPQSSGPAADHPPAPRPAPRPATTGSLDEGSLVMVPAVARARFLSAVSDSLAGSREWPKPSGLSRRRVLQASLVAAAGLVGALPREQMAGEPPLPRNKPETFQIARTYPLQQQAEMTLVPRRKPPVPEFGDRKLTLYNENTGETVAVTYWSEGDYLLEGLESIHWLLRDHHADEMRAIDLKLVELLHAIETKLEITKPLHILSAYRTPQTNTKLAERYDGVALHSFHLEGRAVDLYAPGRRKRDVFKVARAMKAGGVGNYSRYIHLDTGPLRTW